MTEQPTHPSDPAVQLSGTRSQWKRLPQPVRDLVGNAGRVRLTRVREAISADAGLPMPPIRVEPWGWVGPRGGAVLGKAAPFLMKSGNYQFGAQFPASTLLVLDDNTELRRAVCHEFAHCFWWCARVVGAVIGGHAEMGDPVPALNEGQDEFDWQAAKDEAELVEPALWFGPWDTKHFVRRDSDMNPEASNRLLYERWLEPGFPAKVPKLHFEIKGIEVPHEIAGRVSELAAAAAEGVGAK